MAASVIAGWLMRGVVAIALLASALWKLRHTEEFRAAVEAALAGRSPRSTRALRGLVMLVEALTAALLLTSGWVSRAAAVIALGTLATFTVVTMRAAGSGPGCGCWRTPAGLTSTDRGRGYLARNTLLLCAAAVGAVLPQASFPLEALAVIPASALLALLVLELPALIGATGRARRATRRPETTLWPETIGRRRFLRSGAQVVFAAVAGTVFGSRVTGSQVAHARAATGAVVTGRPAGPSQAQVDAAATTMLRSQRARPLTAGGQTYELSRRLVDDGSAHATQRLQTVVHDYQEHRTLVFNAPLAEPGQVRITDALPHVPAPPGDDEYAAAVAVVQRQAPHLLPPGATLSRVMPASTTRHVNGRPHRVIPVGLAWRAGGAVHQRVIGVDLAADEVLDDLNTLVGQVEADCGVPDDDTCERAGGEVGQASVQISDGDTVLWDLVVVRPVASSGRAASGLEVRDVRYRDEMVLRRAHTPIINVQYEPNPHGCGPSYRDWAGEESCFEAHGTDVAPGIRICDARPLTILDGGQRDYGNFRGVAIFSRGSRTVLVTELRAGWYRYVSEIHLHADGTIMPRFGFAAVQNPCTCSNHRHHAYWRLDFDLGGTGSQRVEEINRGQPPILLHHETRRLRDPSRNRRWRIRSATTGTGYTLVPGKHDGTADPFGVGDLWVLRNHPDELDDGAIGRSDAAALDELTVPQEPVLDTEVVLWYAVHQGHVTGASHSRRLGPTLRPFSGLGIR